MLRYCIPQGYKEAVKDKSKGITRWQDYTAFEMLQLKEYEIFCNLRHVRSTKISVGKKNICIYLVYAVKHYGWHKAYFVTDGHMTDKPLDSVYYVVVSLKRICIVAAMAELNYSKLWATDIGNTYLEAIMKEKLVIFAGPEF